MDEAIAYSSKLDLVAVPRVWLKVRGGFHSARPIFALNCARVFASSLRHSFKAASSVQDRRAMERIAIVWILASLCLAYNLFVQGERATRVISTGYFVQSGAAPAHFAF